MSGIINGLYVRNDNRSKELDDRLYKRNITSAPIKMGYSIRSVPTKYVHMPILDCHLPPKEHCGNTADRDLRILILILILLFNILVK